MRTFTRSANQTLALLAVDNIYLSKSGLDLFAAVDRGEVSIADAKESIKARAHAYGSKSVASAVAHQTRMR